MFWGLVLQPGKKYTSVVKESFHLSSVAVDTKTVGKNETGVFPVQVDVDGQELVICNLSNQCLHLSVDLFFDKGTQLTFMTTGKATIHLAGYTSLEEDSEEDSMNEEDSSEVDDDEELKKSIDEYRAKMKESKKNKKKDSPEKRKSTTDPAVAAKKSKMEGPESSDEEDTSGDDFEDNSDLGDFSFSDDNDNEEEVEDDDEDGGDLVDSSEDDSELEDSDSEDAAAAKKKKKKEPQQQPQTPQTPKIKKEQPVSNKKQDKTPGSSKKPEKLNKSITQELTNGVPTKAEKKAQKKSLSKGEIKTPKGNESATTSSQSPKKQSMEGGVMIEELKSGNGPVAKPGKMVSVYYTGRLKNNNRVFDQTNSGPGFKFRLGRGEVIKGWDVALNGMKVGSKRRVTCPPAMAYGPKGSPPSIPPNSSLVFDVELRSVN